MRPEIANSTGTPGLAVSVGKRRRRSLKRERRDAGPPSFALQTPERDCSDAAWDLPQPSCPDLRPGSCRRLRVRPPPLHAPPLPMILGIVIVAVGWRSAPSPFTRPAGQVSTSGGSPRPDRSSSGQSRKHFHCPGEGNVVQFRIPPDDNAKPIGDYGQMCKVVGPPTGVYGQMSISRPGSSDLAVDPPSNGSGRVSPEVPFRALS